MLICSGCAWLSARAGLCVRAVPCTQPQGSRQPQPSRQSQRRRPPVQQAAAQPAGGGGGRPCRAREDVTFVVPGGQTRTPFARVTQSHLNSILALNGAEGFWRPDGKVSRDVEDLPEGGTVDLKLPEVPLLATQARPGAAGSRCPGLQGRGGPLDARMHAAGSTPHYAATPCARCVPADPRPSLVCLLSPAVQVRNLQSATDNATRAKELQLGAFLASLASAEAPGAPLRLLPTTPFAGADGQVRLGWVAAAGDA